MYTIIGETISHPTTLNNQIIACYDLVEDKMIEYASNGLTNIAFAQESCENTNSVNDFHYLILLLVSIYYDMEITTNLGETIDKDQIWEDNNLEAYIGYFYSKHNTDIEQMYEIFNLGSYPYGTSLFESSLFYVDLDPLFPL